MNSKKHLNLQKILLRKLVIIYFLNQSKVSVLNYKDKQDILTNIDLAAEKIIIDTLQKKFPNHALISEEEGDVKKQSDYQWIIDPLDGTKEYLRRIPQFTTSIALEYKGEPVIAVNYHVTPDDMYVAGKGLGAFHNDRELHVSKQDSLDHSIIHVRLPASDMDASIIDKQIEQIKKIITRCYRVRGVVHENTVLSWIASGGADGYVYLGQGSVKGWWDVVTGYLILKEAGGMITNLNGNTFNSDDLINGIIASNGKIHGELLKLLLKP